MLNKLLFPGLVFLVANGLIAQQLSGNIKNQANIPLENVYVRNTTTNQVNLSNSKAQFSIRGNVGDSLEFKLQGYETLRIRAKSESISVVMTERSIRLQEVEVNVSPIKTIIDNDNEHILDFKFINRKIITLNKSNSNYTLSIYDENKPLKTYRIYNFKPKRLEIDTQENIYIISKDSAYQIYCSDILEFVDQTTIEVFESIIVPAVKVEKGLLITESYANHSQYYTLSKIVEGTPSATPLYSSFDQVAHAVASSQYNKILAMYNQRTSAVANVIKNKSWSGDLWELAEDWKLMNEIGWYYNVRARRLNVLSKKKGDELLVFDFLKDSLFIISENDSVKSATSINRLDKKARAEILEDPVTHNFYIYYPFNEKLQIEKIDLATGETRRVLDLDKLVYLEVFDVRAHWLYFLASNKNGYQKLYKTKLDE